MLVGDIKGMILFFICPASSLRIGKGNSMFRFLQWFLKTLSDPCYSSINSFKEQKLIESHYTSSTVNKTKSQPIPQVV